MNGADEVRLQQKHVCIRIFEDDYVMITDNNGERLRVSAPSGPLIGPLNTYHQALWYNTSPT
jgi:hypothetical protein